MEIQKCNLRRQISWQFWLAATLVIASTSKIIKLSITRSYDAVPDQELLWLSESLRLYRGLPTTYSDHPGWLWTVAAHLNLYWLNKFGVIQYAAGDGISINAADSLIKVLRTENALLSAVTTLLLWPIARMLGIGRSLALIYIFLITSSTGFAWSLVAVRHEVASIFFVEVFIILGVLARIFGNYRKLFQSLLIWSLAITSLLLSFYSKIQVIFLLPLLATALLCACTTILPKTLLANSAVLIRSLTTRHWVAMIGSALITAFLVSKYRLDYGAPVGNPIFDMANILFWIFFNTILVHLGYAIVFGGKSISIPLQSREKLDACLRYLLIFLPSILELIFAAFIFPARWAGGWSATVFRSTLLFSDRGLYLAGGAKAVKQGIDINSIFRILAERLYETFALPPIVTIMLFLCVLIAMILSASIYVSRNTRIQTYSSDDHPDYFWKRKIFLQVAAIVSVAMSTLANSARNQPYYAIYIAIPLLMVAFKMLYSEAATRSLKMAIVSIGVILIASASLKSLENWKSINIVSGFTFPESLCYGQQIGIEMKNLSIGKCPNFYYESKLRP